MKRREICQDFLAIKRNSLVTEAATQLRQAVRSGLWADTLPSERALAELIKISRPTLRAALKILLKEGLLTVCARQKYQVRLTTAGSSFRATGRIVLLSPYTLQELEIRIPSVFTWIDYLRERLIRAKLSFEVVARPSCYTGRPQRALAQLAQENSPDCWLLYRSTPAMRQWFSRRRERFLALGSVADTEAVSSLDLDYAAACRHAVGQFARTGHETVALVQFKTGLLGDESSKQVFLTASLTHQPLPLKTFLIEHDGTRGGVCRAVDNLLRLEPRPTAILSTYTQQTVSVFSRLVERGYRIPQNMSLICRDYHPVLGFISPSLAYYQWNYRNYASKIFQTIQSVLHHPSTHVARVRLLPDFVPGASLGRPSNS